MGGPSAAIIGKQVRILCEPVAVKETARPNATGETREGGQARGNAAAPKPEDLLVKAEAAVLVQKPRELAFVYRVCASVLADARYFLRKGRIMETKKSKKGIIILAVVLVVAIVAAIAVYAATRPVGAAGDKTIAIVVDAGEQLQQTTVFHTDQAFLGPLLREDGFVEGEDGEYGLYITAVAGVAADEGKQEWWCITKGGEQVFTGADETPLADGDQFELTLMTGWQTVE